MPDESKRVKKRELSIDFREISLTGSSMYHSVGVPDYNPDSLVGTKGLEVYSKMKEDDQVKAVITMKKYARLMTPWEIQPASEDPMDVEIAEFVESNLNNLGGTFEDNLLNILTALEYGFSITEKVYTLIEKGKYAGKIGLKALKTREPFYYMFESDDYGNLREDGIIYLGPTPSDVEWNRLMQSLDTARTKQGIRFPTSKFIVYSYNKEFSNWYGKSDLRCAYRSWWSKEILIRFFNMYMERFGMPTYVGKVPKGTTPATQKELKLILDRVQAKYSMVIPTDAEVELLEVGGAGEGAFRSAIEMHNKFISRSILVPDLMGFNEVSGGGSYALGKKHFDVFLWILRKLGRDIEETIVGEQIIKQLVDYNYSNVQNYPKFKFESITAEGTATQANIVQMGVAGGFINPEEPWIRDYLALPKREEQYALGMPQPGLEQGIPGQAGQKPTSTEEGLKDGEDTTVDAIEGSKDEDLSGGTTGGQLKGTKSYAEVQRRWKELKDKQTLKTKPVIKEKTTKLEEAIKYAKNGLPLDKRFDYKIDFAKMKEDLDEYENETVDELSKVVEQQRDALLKTVERKGIIEGKDYNAVDSLQLKFVGEFKRVFENRLVKLHLDSKLTTLKEVAEGSPNEVTIVTKFADVTIQNWIPVPPNEAIDFFNRKVVAKVKKKDGKKTLVVLATKKELEYYDSKAFAIAGVERDNILKQAKFILLDGLKQGQSNKDVMFNLRKMFEMYLTTGELVDDELVTPWRLETIVRTNFSEALNAGRKAMFEDQDVKEFVPYLQYKAIMDDRVRPTHEEMHNRIYRADNPIIDVITPPNGFNCRCIMVPITRNEVFNLKEKGQGIELSDDDPLPEGFPDVGFGKYSQDISTLAQVRVEEIANPKQETQEAGKEKLLEDEKARLESNKEALKTQKSEVDSYFAQIKVERDKAILDIQNERIGLTNLLQDLDRKKSELEALAKSQVANEESLQKQIEQITRENEILKEQLKSKTDVATVAKTKVEKQQKKDDKEVKPVENIQEAKKVDIVRCPYPNCGGDLLVIKEDKQGTQTIHCNGCLNDSKVTSEGDVYLFDKVKNEWIKQDYKLQPKNITGEK